MDTFLNVRCPDLQPTRKGRVKKNPIRALRAIHGSAADGHIYLYYTMRQIRGGNHEAGRQVQGIANGQRLRLPRSRNSEESKFKDWREKTERKLEDVFGKGSEQPGRLKSLKFFDFTKHGPGVPQENALREDERAQYPKGL
jgi:hypothetical protein